MVETSDEPPLSLPEPAGAQSAGTAAEPTAWVQLIANFEREKGHQAADRLRGCVRSEVDGRLVIAPSPWVRSKLGPELERLGVVLNQEN